jgi:hypothetical protein
MAILILGDQEDEHACHMLRHLRQQGADVELLDSKSFPARLRVAFDPQRRSGTITLPEGRRLAFDEISAVYWRRYGGIPYPALPDSEQAFVAYNDARGLFESLLIDLPARWVNSWRAYQLHQTKPVQLAKVAALGVAVPATLQTNDPAAVREFVGCHARVIFKPIQGGAHTQVVTERHLSPENLRNLDVAPVTLQEEVPGTDIRVFVAGQRVVACQVLSPELDYRADPSPRIEAIPLPDDVEGHCRQIAAALDLRWTGIDFRRTPEDRYVFFEANPSPMFLGFEKRCGLPLTAMLGALLLGGEP